MLMFLEESKKKKNFIQLNRIVPLNNDNNDSIIMNFSIHLLFSLLLLLLLITNDCVYYYNCKKIKGPLPNDVIGVELFQRDNAKEHRTYKYELLEKKNPALVIRRGDPFYLAIQLRNVYDQDNNKIRLEFLFGKLNFAIFFHLFSVEWTVLSLPLTLYICIGVFFLKKKQILSINL